MAPHDAMQAHAAESVVGRGRMSGISSAGGGGSSLEFVAVILAATAGARLFPLTSDADDDDDDVGDGGSSAGGAEIEVNGDDEEFQVLAGDTTVEEGDSGRGVGDTDVRAGPKHLLPITGVPLICRLVGTLRNRRTRPRSLEFLLSPLSPCNCPSFLPSIPRAERIACTKNSSSQRGPQRSPLALGRSHNFSVDTTASKMVVFAPHTYSMFNPALALTTHLTLNQGPPYLFVDDRVSRRGDPRCRVRGVSCSDREGGRPHRFGTGGHEGMRADRRRGAAARRHDCESGSTRCRLRRERQRPPIRPLLWPPLPRQPRCCDARRPLPRGGWIRAKAAMRRSSEGM